MSFKTGGKYDWQGMTLLEGDQQTGKLAQLLLDSVMPRPRNHKQRVRKVKREPFDPVKVAENFGRIIFPIILNCAPRESIAEILSVQPMAGPAPDLAPTFYFEQRTKRTRWHEWVPSARRGERVYRYKYGGVLAERGGFFIVHERNPQRVLAYNLTWMS